MNKAAFFTIEVEHDNHYSENPWQAVVLDDEGTRIDGFQGRSLHDVMNDVERLILNGGKVPA